MLKVQAFVAAALVAAQLVVAAPLDTMPPSKDRLLDRTNRAILVPKLMVNKPDGPVILADWNITKAQSATAKFAPAATATTPHVQTVTETITVTPNEKSGGTPTAIQVVATVTAVVRKFDPHPPTPPQWWGKTYLPGYSFRVRWWEHRLVQLRGWALRAHVRAAQHRAKKAALRLATRRRRILWSFRQRKHHHRRDLELEQLD
ncbi:hypothetical protein HGRIS_014156 [Hohenbuehelia grisea]|uniref:Uncharacterized protein n=1 Tax=Hohenbuehelia grisea TaxID=104357 RepID=A0ABR3JT64_9AGAR